MKAQKLSRRSLMIGLLAVAVLGLTMLAAAPGNNKINTGSTWGNEPEGYGAWYDYMQTQGMTIERWQRPISELLEKRDGEAGPATLLQVISPDAPSGASLNNSALATWKQQGNHLIVLTKIGSVTAADFSTEVDFKAGAVTVETRRRFNPEATDATLVSSQAVTDQSVTDQSVTAQSAANQQDTPMVPLLADDYGAVVWQRNSDGQGLETYSSTPFIGANAYLSSPGNFAFLSELVQQSGGPIWVDEYLHGYKDSDVVIKETAGSWVSYLAKTPWLIAAVQGGVILLVALIAQNRRVGSRQTLPTLQVDNSEAYIKALAGVLHKANNHDFLVETLSRAERKTLQRALGLGDAPVSPETLETAWQQTTGRSAAELKVLKDRPQDRHRSDRALQAWIRRLQALPVRAARKETKSARQ